MTNSLGHILTFYSYKGGVGRSMALANVAVQLAKWRRKVLIVDWDLEAPGIEGYFKNADPSISERRKNIPGVIDLVQSAASKGDLNWHDCLLSVKPFESGEDLMIISAGKDDGEYISRVQGTNWQNLFDEHGLGVYLESLRNAWKEEFDFILIDSRTGITDIGGVCTIHLPDFLVIWFTTNWTSLQGVKYVAERARLAHERLPFDRNQLLVLPVPARDESRTEWEKANKWKGIIATELGDFYKEWIPAGGSPADVVEKLRIPYIPYWSFEEGLPVIEEGTSDVTSLGGAYENLSRLVFFNLEWAEIAKNPEKSTEYLSRAVEDDFQRLGPEYAEARFNEALLAWQEGRADDSAEAAKVAIDTWRRLSSTDVKSFGMKLAKARSFLSERLNEAGDIPGSTLQAIEAINAYRALHQTDPIGSDEEVATGLGELATRLYENGEIESANEALKESINIERTLAHSDPKFLSSLARKLYNLSNQLISVEQVADALSAINEAVDIYRGLTLSNREMFEPELGLSLNTYSGCLLETGDVDGALEASRQAVEIFSRLTQQDLTQYESDLASSYNDLLDGLSRVEISEVEGAINTVRGAVNYFKDLAAKDRRYEPDLAKSLNMLPEPLKKQGEVEEALRTQLEAVEIFRRLKQQNQTRFEPELALSLINASKLFLDNNNISNSRDMAAESLEILERLSRRSPALYKEDIEEAKKLLGS